MVSLVTEERHETAAARLRAIGQRYTPNRRTLVEVLSGARQPLTIPEILSDRPGLAQSSVYRNLGVLRVAKVARRVLTSEEFARYELTEDLTEHHHHLVCSSCGAVEDFTVTSRLERTMQRAITEATAGRRFAPLSHRLDLIGLCGRCA